MASSSPAHDQGPVRRHAVRRPQRRGRYLSALVLTGLMVFTGSGLVFAYHSVQGRVVTHDLDGILGRDTPDAERGEDAPAPDDPLDGRSYNVMVLGSDARASDDDDDQFSFTGGMRSDTNLIMHIPADRSRIDVVSIPRDLLVDVPACPLPDGSQTAPMAAGTGDEGTRFNAAFAYGGQTGDVAYGAACAILTVEEMTGLYIDDFVVVDFDGFESVIDTIGGVRMCFDEAIDAPKADLQLQAGCQELDGEAALGVARARVGVDDGSDISRIGRQQELFAAIADEVLGSSLVTDTPALLRFTQATADSMTTSERIGNLSTMAGLAYSMRHLDTSDVTFATTPFDWAGNVVTQNADTEALWESLRNSEPLVIPDDDDGGPDEDDPVDPQHSGQGDVDNAGDGTGSGDAGDGNGGGDGDGGGGTDPSSGQDGLDAGDTGGTGGTGSTGSTGSTGGGA